MKYSLLFLCIAVSVSVFGNELLKDRFDSASLSSAWHVSGGEFRTENGALLIRSGESNPGARTGSGSWKNYRVDFTLTRRGYSHFDFYIGMRYPEFIRFTLQPPHQGKLLAAIGKRDGSVTKLDEMSYGKSIDMNIPLRISVIAQGTSASFCINGTELLEVETGPVSGEIVLGGGWNSDFEVRDLSVTQLPAPPKKEKPVADRFTRPEIKNGTFYWNGKPTFMLGVNDSSNFWEFSSVNAKPPYEPNDIYTDLLSKETAEKLGFNCNHVYTYARSVSDDSLGELGLTPEQADQLLGYQYRNHWAQRDRHRSRIAGMPLVVDYSLLHLFTMDNLAGRIAKAGQAPELRHDGGFMPYIPELPLGRSIYNIYFRDGARYWLDGGNSNPWVYELFNEVQWYHSKHPLNLRLFVEYLHKKYDGDLGKLRSAWGDETPESFEAVTTLKPWSGGTMKADWMDFLGDRFVEIFNEGKAMIRKVDPRPNVYFDIEIAVSSLWYEQNGIDYYKLMKSADLFGTEGGMPFGNFELPKEVGYLDAVMNSKHIEVMFYNDLAKTFAGDKPIMNQEAYVRRSHGELGVIPARRSDFPTLFWFEVFHNYSGSQVYCWWKGGQNYPWQTLEDARATTKKVPPALLNPYAYPLESLKGFKDFEEEIGRLAEIALPYPRTVQEIGILYSLPSVWRQPHAVSHTQKFAYQQNCFNWYEAFVQKQLPVGVIAEQELIEKGAGSYRVIAVPYPSHCFPGTIEALRKFAAGGGIVLLGEGSLRFDQYGREWKDNRIGGSTVAGISAGIPAEEQQKRLLEELAKKGYRIPWEIRSEEAMPQLEVRAIRRKEVDLYFLCDWDGRRSSFARFVPGTRQKNVFVTDMVSGRAILSPSGKAEWSTTELGTGIPVAIPSQERVLLAVSDSPMAGAGRVPLTESVIREKAAAQAKELAETLAPFDRELAALRSGREQAYRGARAPYPVTAENCFPLDLTGVVNMGFRDEVAGDRKGGWTDQGAMDFREFPVGKQIFAGVPFEVIDPAKNNGKSCLVLAGSLKYFPAESGEIPVNAAAGKLYFLHTAAWGGQEGKQFEYRILYEDGSTAVFSVNGGRESADWVGNNAISNGRIVAETVKANGVKAGAYVTCWRNPSPEKKIRALKAVSALSDPVPIVIGITAER